jgi:hypothetical protein
MADTKISALSAVSAAAGANEFPVNESGASKKATLTQFKTYLGLIVKSLGSDTATISSTTKVKATNIDQTLDTGTWLFEYKIVYRSDTAGTGMSFGVNFSGTQTTFIVEGTQFEATTLASTGAVDQDVVSGTTGLRSGGAGRSPSTTASIGGSTSVDTINVDILFCIKGIVVVTVSGDLQLYYGSEVDAAGNQIVKAPTSLLCWKVA